jgi:hypothetical protein
LAKIMVFPSQGTMAMAGIVRLLPDWQRHSPFAAGQPDIRPADSGLSALQYTQNNPCVKIISIILETHGKP